MGFEMPGNDDSRYACLGERGHFWVYWMHLLDLFKAFLNYESTIFPPFFKGSHLSCSMCTQPFSNKVTITKTERDFTESKP